MHFNYVTVDLFLLMAVRELIFDQHLAFFLFRTFRVVGYGRQRNVSVVFHYILDYFPQNIPRKRMQSIGHKMDSFHVSDKESTSSCIYNCARLIF